MAARPAGANPPALKIKLKPRKEQGPVSTVSQQITSQPNSSQPKGEEDGNARESDGEMVSEGAAVKRKLPSPTSSPSSSKRVAREEGSPALESCPPLSAAGEHLEVYPGRSQQHSATEPVVLKQQIGQPHSSVVALLERDQALQVPTTRTEDDETCRPSSKHRSSTIALENISHGQLLVSSVVPCSNQDDTSPGDTFSRATGDASIHQQVYPFAWAKPVPQHYTENTVTIIPSHASWFKWDRIHKLERQAFPQFFYGKSKLPSPELYLQVRNAVIMKYRANSRTSLRLSDIRGLHNFDDKDLAQILDFLVHWGLVNYQAELKSESVGFRYPTNVPVYLDEDEQGSLALTSLPLTPLEYLHQFEPLHAPAMALKCLAAEHEPPVVIAENVVKEAHGVSQSTSMGNCCSSCAAYCSHRHYYCEKQADYILCPNCFSDGKLGIGMATTDFILLDGSPETAESVDNSSWSDQETLMLLEAVEIYGDNWTEISEFVGTKSKAQCIAHFIGLPIEDRFFEDMEVPRSFITVDSNSSQPSILNQKLHTTECSNNVNKSEVQVASVWNKLEHSKDSRLQNGGDQQASVGMSAGGSWFRPEVQVAFAEAGNPVISLVAFLASTVGPRVAAAAAHTALQSLSEDHQQALQTAGDLRAQNIGGNTSSASDVASDFRRGEASNASLDNHTGKDEAREGRNPESSQRMAGNQQWRPSSGSVKKATAAALLTAAMKAKMLADQEEREVQRLAAIIVDNQLKKLSFKLKQLGDIDPILERECDQIDKNRARFSADRIRFMSSRLGSAAPVPSQMPATGNAAALNIRPTAPASVPSVPASANVAEGAHPSGMLRPMMYTFGHTGMPVPVSGSGMPVPVSGSMVKPPS